MGPNKERRSFELATCRLLIKARTDEGRKRAQARGVRFGRRPKLTAHQRREALARGIREARLAVMLNLSLPQRHGQETKGILQLKSRRSTDASGNA